jgi:hypothetical protein
MLLNSKKTILHRISRNKYSNQNKTYLYTKLNTLILQSLTRINKFLATVLPQDNLPNSIVILKILKARANKNHNKTLIMQMMINKITMILTYC